MPPSDNLGIAAARQARTASIIARQPHLADRLLGRKPMPIAGKSHKITVDCRTGKRTVETVEALAVNPFVRPPKAKIPPPPPIAVPPTVCRPDGVRAILAAVAAAWHVNPLHILGPGRCRRLSYPRFAAMRLMSERLSLSTPLIGLTLGRRDHTTALSGLGRAAFLHRNDVDWRRRFDAAEADLNAKAEVDGGRLRAPEQAPVDWKHTAGSSGASAKEKGERT